MATCVAASVIGMHLGMISAAANIGTGIGRSADWFKGIRSQSYGETFSDDIPIPAFALTSSEPPSAINDNQPIAPVFNSEAATTLDADITYKKIKLKVKTAAPAA